MKSSLKTLTRIQKFNIDEQRKLMVEQQNKEEQILNDIAALNRRFEEEKAFAREHAGIGDFGLYVKRYLRLRMIWKDVWRLSAAGLPKYVIKSPICLKSKKPLKLLMNIVKLQNGMNLTPKSRKCLMKSEPMPI